MHQESEQGSPPGNPNPTGSCGQPSAQSNGMDTSCTGKEYSTLCQLVTHVQLALDINHLNWCVDDCGAAKRYEDMVYLIKTLSFYACAPARTPYRSTPIPVVMIRL